MRTAKFPSQARWIWDDSDRSGYHYYLRARKMFRARVGESATLQITADANYQVWLNGRIVGDGPAKSAEGRRSVDSYETTPHLVNGKNQLDVLVLSIGVGTMTYYHAPVGLIFAALVRAAIPTLLVFVFCQNIILRGIVVPVEK